nr:alginate lyase family protein [Rhodovulum robiginosum]
MPKGVAPTASERNACFAKGEKALIARTIDRDRIAVTGCDTGVVAPRKTLSTYPVYLSGSGQRGDVFDCRKVRLNELSSGYLDRYLEEVVAATDAAGGDPDARAALCAANMLYTWAKHDGMEVIGENGSRNQARSERSWTLGSLSAAYLKSRGTRARAARMPVGATSDKNEVILDWFSTLSYGTLDYIGDRRRQGLDHTNIQYWNGYAMLPTAILTGDGTLFRASEAIFESAIDQITEDPRPERDGFLPRELMRGSKAQGYHVFALKPILGMAILSTAHDCDFVDTGWEAGQIESLARTVFEGYFFEDKFARAIPRFTDNPPVKQNVWNPAGLGYLVAQLDPQMYLDLERHLQEILSLSGPDAADRKARWLFKDGEHGADEVDLKLGGKRRQIVEGVSQLRGECPFPREVR